MSDSPGFSSTKINDKQAKIIACGTMFSKQEVLQVINVVHDIELTKRILTYATAMYMDPLFVAYGVKNVIDMCGGE